MYKQRFIIISLLILILIISLDIIIRVWYHFDINLIFSSSEFNNILTPILTLIATIIYGWALLTTIRQNKIILSQNIKPFFEKEIEKLLKEAKETEIDKNVLYPGEKINVINYVRYVNQSMFSLLRNSDYNEDYENYKENKDSLELPLKYLESRSYYADYLFLSQFTVPLGPVHFFYGDLKELIKEINKSNLILEDKILLKKQIHRTFLKEYMSFISYQKEDLLALPPIPIIEFMKRPAVVNKFDDIAKTDYGKYYDFFEKEFDEK